MTKEELEEILEEAKVNYVLGEGTSEKDVFNET